MCLRGECYLLVDDGHRRTQLPLDDPTLGVHVPPRVWTSLYRFSADAILLVLASEPYDPSDYVRDYDEFLGLVGGHPA